MLAEQDTDIEAVFQIPTFGTIPRADVLANDDLFIVIHDKFPVSPGHALIIARRKGQLFQQLTQQERIRLLFWVEWTQKHLA